MANGGRAIHKVLNHVGKLAYVDFGRGAVRNTVSGIMTGPGADFPAEGRVKVHTPGDQWIEWPLEIEADGSYFLDMTAQHDVVEDDEVQVFYGPWGWNQVERDIYAVSTHIYLPLVLKNS